MKSFIDVRGEAALVERVNEYRADLSVTVRAAQAENAIDEVEALRTRCIRGLRDSGILDSEISEGAGEVWRPWFWKKKPGQEASRRILLCCSDVTKLFAALSALEPIFAGQRYSISVSMRRPGFQPTPDDRCAAEAGAIEDARRKAQVLADAAHARLGGVAQIEEIDARVGGSGVVGDEEWRFPFLMGGGATAAAGDSETETIEAASRTRTLRFRVRFRLEPEPPAGANEDRMAQVPSGRD